MKFLFVLFAINLTTVFCFAGLKSEGKTHLTLSKADSRAQLTVDEGFHFNTEAPTYLEANQTKIAPTSASAKQLLFRWTIPLSAGAKIRYYVCDDAKTVCEPHVETLADAVTQPEIKNTLPTTAKTLEPERDEEGFIVDNLTAGLKEAQKKKSLVLIDFTATWCPACIRLIHESFNTPLFKTAAANYVLVKIDVDREENQKLMEKYSIHAFPTMVITNAQGLEVDRILDFLPASPLAQRLDGINTSRPSSIAELKKKALAGDKAAALALGKNAYLAQQPKECLDWFSISEQKPLEHYQCLINHSEDSKPEVHSQDLLKAIEAFPASFYSIDWRLQLVELFKDSSSFTEQKKKYLGEAEALTQKWLTSPELTQQANSNNELIELKDLVIPELYYYLGTIYEAQNKKEDASKQFELAIQKTLDLKPTTDNPTIIIYLVHYLKKTHPIEEALSWLQKLEKAYPKEFTYGHRQASLLAEVKEFTKALPVAEKAFNLSYGSNKLKTGLLLAKIKKELRQNKDAKLLLKNLQASKSAKAKGNKHYLEKIQQAIKELE